MIVEYDYSYPLYKRIFSILETAFSRTSQKIG